jgi:hypothetical protein
MNSAWRPPEAGKEQAWKKTEVRGKDALFPLLVLAAVAVIAFIALSMAAHLIG